MRTNEVLPYFISMKEDGNKNLPIILPEKECPACGKQLKHEGLHLICTNLNCPGRSVSSIYNWVIKRNMKNVGIKFLETAFEKGIIKNILDLYNPQLEEKIGSLERFIPGGGRVSKIVVAIEKSKENVTDLDILSSIGIQGIGRSVLENLHLTNIDTLPSDVMGEGNFKMVDEDIIPISDDRPSKLQVYRYISDWLTQPGNYTTLIKLKKILNSKAVDISNYTISGKTIVITGKFDKSRTEIEATLKQKGYRVMDHVSKDIDYLLVGDKPSESKLTKVKNSEKIKVVFDIKDIV